MSGKSRVGRCLKGPFASPGMRPCRHSAVHLPREKQFRCYKKAEGVLNWEMWWWDQLHCLKQFSELTANLASTDQPCCPSGLLVRLFLISFLVSLLWVCGVWLLMPPALAIFWLSLLRVGGNEMLLLPFLCSQRHPHGYAKLESLILHPNLFKLFPICKNNLIGGMGRWGVGWREYKLDMHLIKFRVADWRSSLDNYL